MLQLSGRVKGKTYKNELVSADELLSLFGVPEKILKDDAFFEIDSQYVKTDRFGVTKFPRGYGFPSRINGTFEGNNVVLHYYENETVRADGRVNRTPDKVKDFRNRVMTLNPETNKEKVAFYYLAPYCGTSPLYRKGQVKYYNYVDKEKKASKSLSGERDLYALYGMIFEEKNLLKLRRKAKGIRIKGNTIPGVEKMGLQELQDSLIKMAKTFPVEFRDVYNSADTDVRGIINEAIQYGIVTTRRIGSDMKEIRFNDEYGGDRISKIDINARPEDVLYSMVLDKWTTLGKRIEKEVNQFGKEMLAEELKKSGGLQVPKMEEIEAVPEEILTAAEIEKMHKSPLIKRAFDDGFFYVDEINNNIHFRKSDNSVDPIPLVEKYTGDVLKAIAAKVGDQERKRIETLLKKKYK